MAWQQGLGQGLKDLATFIGGHYDRRREDEQLAIENALAERRMKLGEEQQQGVEQMRATELAQWLAENAPGGQVGPEMRENIFGKAGLADTLLSPQATESNLPSKAMNWGGATLPSLLQGSSLGEPSQVTMPEVGSLQTTANPAKTAGFSNILPTQSSKERIAYAQILARQQRDAELNEIKRSQVDLQRKRLQLDDYVKKAGLNIDMKRVEAVYAGLDQQQRALELRAAQIAQQGNIAQTGLQLREAGLERMTPMDAMYSQFMPGVSGATRPIDIQDPFTPTSLDDLLGIVKRPAVSAPPAKAPTGPRFKIIQ